MTNSPQYAFNVGSSITAHGVRYVINEVTPTGFRVTIAADGSTTFLPHARMSELVTEPGVRIEHVTSAGQEQRQRLDGAASYLSLGKRAQEISEVKAVLVQAMRAVRETLRLESRKPNLQLTARLLDQRPVRERLTKIVNQHTPVKIALRTRGGDNSQARLLYTGKTLAKLLRDADAAPLGTSLYDTCAPLFHRRGHSGDRLRSEVRFILDDALMKARLATQNPSVASVRTQARELINNWNKTHGLNGDDALKLPSHKTVTRHIQTMNRIAREIARSGWEHTVNNMTPGRSDVSALLLGEYVQVDECHLSLVNRARKSVQWGEFDDDERKALEKIDEDIRARFILTAALDVSSGYALAWTLSHRTGTVNLERILLMATRSKMPEKLRYNCQSDPLPAMGIAVLKTDNATTLRNVKTITRAADAGITIQQARAGRPTDKAFIERLFRTVEDELAQILLGYTGRRPGEVKGSNPFADGTINIGKMEAILAQYFIDVFPNTLRKSVVYGQHMPELRRKDLEATYGFVPPIDPVTRRYALGWRYDLSVTKMGVSILGGISFNSTKLQIEWEDSHPKSDKAKVFIDPDDLSAATVILPGRKDLIEVPLSTTFFAGMSAVEAIIFMEKYRLKYPADVVFHERRAMDARAEISALVAEDLKNHERLRSTPTQDECEAKAAQITRNFDLNFAQMEGTAVPGSLTAPGTDGGALPLGGYGDLIEAQASDASVGRKPRSPAKRKSLAAEVQFDAPDETKKLR